MGPAEELEEGPPEGLEEGELRGLMSHYPTLQAARAHPLTTRLLEHLKERGDEVIQVYPREGVRWRAREVRARALQLAAGLRALGVRPGDRVSVVCARHPEYGPLLLATLLVGAAWAPFNSGLDDAEMRLLLGSVVRPKVLLAPPPTAQRLRKLLAALHAEGKASGAVVVTLSEGSEWEALVAAEGDEAQLPPPPVDPRAAIAVVACSSGTTGPSKGVCASHFNMIAALNTFTHTDTILEQKETLLLTSPGFWVTGIWFTMLSMASDWLLVYVFGSNEEELLEAIEVHKPPVLFSGNNFLLSTAKAHEQARPRRDLSSLNTVICGGATMSPQAEQFVASILGCEVLHMYAMTELNSGIGMVRRPRYKAGSVGTLGPFMRCRVVDPASGAVQPANQEGELRFKGPTLTCGYLNNVKATAELFDAHGWLRSGDLGMYDDEGFFWVTGRIKDTIKFRGCHVSPVDVEGVLEEHGAVLESAVVGVPDPLNGELPRAYVVLRPGERASAEELVQLVQDRLADHKWLRGGVVFVDALPKTPTGKINRAALRKQMAKELNAGGVPGPNGFGITA